MPTFFLKPENALKRANEFIDVGKKDSALEVLNDVIRSRKHRQKWTSVHENIMILYTKLCVQLQRSSYAKDGLYQYRNICKEVAPSSFEKVIKGFLELAEEKANSARQESEATVLQEVEDLDVVMTPESLLLSTVSGEGAKERTDRVLLTPWVKFLWESYRNMLELLKNNLASLSVYADVAKKAFKFCLNYQRRTEYRKLCDILRNHLAQAEKYQSQQHTLKLDQVEVIQHLVDVRFDQLETSIAVDLWQEAFRAIEEIHKLLTMSGKSPKASLLENFYSRQAKVYMMAKNQLFHAAALHKLFILRKEQKKTLTTEECQITASQVLLSTLCVPIEPIPSETDRFLEVDDNSRDKVRRLAALLRMDTPPSRATLMKDFLLLNMLQLLPTELQDLYRYLEIEFNPLHLCERVMPIIESLEEQEDLKQYVELLKKITLARLIKQVSQVYESIELNRLLELAPFTTTTELEKVVVEMATSNNIQVRIDHRTKSLCFGSNLDFSHQAETPEGPYVQSVPSEMLCNQLIVMSEALQQAVHIISSTEVQAEHQAVARKAYQDYQSHCRGDHHKTLRRGQEIEARKEFIESRVKAKIKKKDDEKRKKLQQERWEEKKRLENEAVLREAARRNKEVEEMQLKVKREKVESLKNTAVGKRAFADITNEELKEMDADVIFSKQLKQIEKEKRDKEVKLKSQEKKVDYFERAKRLVELSLLRQQCEYQLEADRQFHIEQENEKISLAIKERDEAVEASKCLKVMREDETKFKKELQLRRKEKLKGQLAVFEEKLSVVRAESLTKRKEQRKERKKAETAAAKEEEEARLMKLKREEEELKREKERCKREEERHEQEAQLEQTRQIQLKREQEIEEKMRKREAQEREEMQRERNPPRKIEEEDDWRRGREEKDVEPPPPTATTHRGPPRDVGEEERDSGYTSQQGTPKIRDEGGPKEEGVWKGGGPRRRERGDDDDNWRRGGDGDDKDGWKGRLGEDESRRGDRDGRNRDDRDSWRGSDKVRRGYDQDDNRGPRRDERSDDWRREAPSDSPRGSPGRDRGPRGSPRDYGRDRGPRDFDRDRGPRDYGRDRGPRDFDRDRGPRDFDRDRGPRDFDRDRGPRDFDRDRGPRDFDRDRGPRDFDRDRGPRDYGRDRGPRDFDRDRGPRDFDRDRGPRDYGRDRRPPRDSERDGDGGGSWNRGNESWRNRDDRGDREKKEGGLRADDGGAWRRSDPSPPRGDGQDNSLRRQQDKDGFEIVNRRR